MVGPNYHPPENCIPDGWKSASCSANTLVQAAWWQEFHDPLLDRCIEAAACCNKDILTAGAAIFQARAVRQMAASQLFPQVNGNFDASRTYFSKNGPLFQSGTALLQAHVPQIQNVYTALIDASWEIDLFGKIRRGIEAADAELGSAIEEKNDILISVIAEVARNYIDLRSAQQKAVLIEDYISLLEEEAAVVQDQYQRGLVDRLNVENIEAEIATQKASLPTICAEIYQYIYALSILTGELPEALFEELHPTRPLPKPEEQIVCGLRSDLLRRRPDIRQAERTLAAATANIGVAVASFFPSLSLTGNIGLQSVMIRNLFQAGSKTWSIGAGSVLPIFQGGNLIGNLRLSEGQAAAAAFTYQQTILKALQEAESVLIAYTKEAESRDHLKEAVERYAELNFLTKERYEKGLVNINKLFDSDRQLNTSKQNLLDAEKTLLLDLIALNKALGGGWEIFQE